MGRGQGYRQFPPERVRLVLDQLAAGLPVCKAAAAGVSASYAYQLHRKMGGVYRPPRVTYSARYLDREGRYELARLREAGRSMRQIAARLGRSPSTVNRELRRNADLLRHSPEVARQRRIRSPLALGLALCRASTAMG